MVTLNKYLRKIGVDESTWPFKQVIENEYNYKNGKSYDSRYVSEAPLNDGRIMEGFIHAECFSMDIIIAMEMFSNLSYFKEFVSHYKDEDFNAKLDLILDGLRIQITQDHTVASKTQTRKIRRSWKLLGDIIHRLWY